MLSFKTCMLQYATQFQMIEGAKKTVYTHISIYISREKEHKCDKTLTILNIGRGIQMFIYYYISLGVCLKFGHHKVVESVGTEV